MKILMISGYKGSGKDEAAKYLMYKDFKKVSFAGPLKDMVAKEYGLDRFIFDDQEYKETALPDYPVISENIFSRDLHKKFLSEFRTKSGKVPTQIYYEDDKLKLKSLMSDGLVTLKEQVYWTPRALLILHGTIARSVNPLHWVEKAVNTKGYPGIVISDWRLKSEYDAVAKIVGKENITTIRINRYESNSVQETERNLDNFNFDYVIENKGTLNDFYNKLAQIKL